MAGRGTDIKLGGMPYDAALQARARAAGGLLVIGTEHHDQGRRDAQLRGRAGRQGDPGRSVIHASLQDELLRDAPMPMLPAEGDGPVDPSMAQRLVGQAQRRRAAHGYDQRLALMRFDAVIERQRDAIIAQRLAIRDDPAPLRLIAQLRHDTIDDLIKRFAPRQAAWEIDKLDAAVRSILTLAVPIAEPADRAAEAIALRARIGALADDWMARKVVMMGEAEIGAILRLVMLALIDQLWAEQTERLEHLKRMIGDRRLPPHRLLPEFEIEAFALFDLLAKEFRHEVTAHAMRLGRP
jgi:preprotein translocase subunit SecA